MSQPTTATVGGDPAALQSQDHRDLLDVVDKIRSQGLGRFVDLPQIIVCGDQSSGKSSALEAISGMSFPAKDNLCTRFATELVLRRTPTVGIDISIIPGSDRADEEKDKLKSFSYTGTLEELDLGKIVDDAKNTMGLTGTSKVFSTDILRVEVCGPSQPHLTMVDLPGLFLAGNKDQSEEDAALVESLVLSYMKNPRTIILAVVSAKSDFALQQVTRHARLQDPMGMRTLGLITKPDTLDQGSDSERFYVELAQNKDVKFRLGWHVLRNRSFAERDEPSNARDAAELAFFSEGVWKSLKSTQLGVSALRLRLSHVLREQILRQLPNVLDDVTKGIKDCKLALRVLGTSRATIAEQRQYLLKVSADFTDLTRAAIDGVYRHDFFAEVNTRRLRAVVQKTLASFAEDIRLNGHAKTIIDGPVPDASESSGAAVETKSPTCISRSDYLKEVKRVMEDSRGRELPGTYNPMVVAELFSKQCKPWQGMVHDLVERVFVSAAGTIESAVHYLADNETAQALLCALITPKMEELKNQLIDETDKILAPHLSGHPITYNHYLTDNVQKIQAQRQRKLIEAALENYFGVGALKSSNQHANVPYLLDTLCDGLEQDMETYSCSMATDMMGAYYKVALKTVVDSVSTLAIEHCLMQKLPSIFTPELICGLTDSEVQRIAAESPESAAERAQTTEKLAVLENALAELKRLKMHGVPALENGNGA